MRYAQAMHLSPTVVRQLPGEDVEFAFTVWGLDDERVAADQARQAFNNKT